MESKIKSMLEMAIDGVFDDAHEIFKTHSGDITPAQSFRLDELVEELAELITEQVSQNL